MSLVPLLHDLLDELNRQSLSELSDQNFALGLHNNEELLSTRTFLRNPLCCGYLRPWRNQEIGKSGISSIQSDKNEFIINLDVQQFRPEELKVTVSDGYVVVDGNHEERSDEHGFISRQFTRKYKLPDNVNESAIASTISSDGVLTLKAPLQVLPGAESRVIPITVTNKPAIKASKSKKKKEENKEK